MKRAERTHPAVVEFANLLHLEYNVPLTMAQAFVQLLMVQFRLALDDVRNMERSDKDARRRLIIGVTNDVMRAYLVGERNMPTETFDGLLLWMYKKASETWGALNYE